MIDLAFTLEVVFNLSLLVALSVVSGFIGNNWKKETVVGCLLQGILFGSAAVLGMLHPFKYAPGLIFDGRSVMISLCGHYFGPLAAGISCIPTVITRIIQGGSGMHMGVAVILVSAVVGSLYHSKYGKKTETLGAGHLLLFGMVVHAGMLLMTLWLPAHMIVPVFNRIYLPVMITYPLATVLIGKILSDQEARNRFVDQVTASEARYRNLYESMMDASVEVNMAGTIQTCNNAFEMLLGYSKPELMKLSYKDITPEKWHAMEDRIVSQQIIPRGYSDVYQKEYRRKDGTVFPVELRTFLLRNASNQPTGMWAIIRDITERKRHELDRLELERELLHAQKLESLGVLAGGVAHDFNNLLTAIQGNLQLIEYDTPPGSPIHECLKEALDTTRRAANLTRQMLAYSGRGQFSIEALNLSHLMDEMTQLLKVSLSKTAILKKDLANDLPRVHADAAQLQQVVMNLITNASEAIGDRPGEIIIRTGRMQCDKAYLEQSCLAEKPDPGLFVFFEVQDNGCGMDLEVQQRLFDPFFTTKFTGRGLGMSSVLGIVKGHKGAIMVKSQPGVGTGIRVLLPVPEAVGKELHRLGITAPNAPTAPKAMPAASTVATQGKGIILVVDDEPPVLSLLKKVLGRAGYTVLSANDGQEGVAVFKKHSSEVACAVLDLTMPKLSGLEAGQEILRIRPGVPILLSSGYDSHEIRQKYSAYQFAGFIQKPFESATLIQTVEAAIQQAGNIKQV